MENSRILTPLLPRSSAIILSSSDSFVESSRFPKGRKQSLPHSGKALFAFWNREHLKLTAHLIAQLRHKDGGACQQRHQGKPEQQAGDQPPQIAAFVAGQPLGKSIRQHGQHQQHHRLPGRNPAQEKPHRRHQDAAQLTGASGAQRKLFAAPEKGAVAPTVAPKQDGKPAIQPGKHLRLGQDAKGDGRGEDEDVVQNRKNHRDQRTDTGCFGCFGLGVLPDQKQNQTGDRDAAAQQSPAEAAVVHNGRSVVLRLPTIWADDRIFSNLLTAFSTEHQKIPPFLQCIGNIDCCQDLLCLLDPKK